MNQSVLEYLQTPVARSIMMVALLAVIVMVGYYMVLKVRDFAQGGAKNQSSHDILTQFRQLRDEGDMDDKEFGSVKSVLGDQMKQELNLEATAKPQTPANSQQDDSEQATD